MIAADCTAYAYGNLTAIIRKNDIKSVTIIRMEVPCCAGGRTIAYRNLNCSSKISGYTLRCVPSKFSLCISIAVIW